MDKATKKNRKDHLLFERDKCNSRDLKEIQRGDTIRVNCAILFRKYILLREFISRTDDAI